MTLNASPGVRGRLSASVIPEHARLTTWRETFGREFLKLNIEPLDEQPFHHDIEFLAMEQLNVSRGTVSAVKYEQTQDMLSDSDDNLTLLIPNRGQIELHEGGHEARIGQGDALIRRSTEVGTTFSTAGEHIALMLPRESVMRALGNRDDFGFAVVRDDDQTLRLLKTYVNMLMNSALLPPEDETFGAYAAEMISRHVHEVVGLLLGASRDAWQHSGEAGGLFAVRIAAVHAAIARNATNPAFSVHDVARQLNLSAGYIRKLLASHGQRFSDLLRAERLDHAHRMLRAPHMSHLDITQIAYDSGFNDISYFNRCFRQRFNATPSDADTRAPRDSPKDHLSRFRQVVDARSPSQPPIARSMSWELMHDRIRTMKKIIIAATFGLFALPAAAQDTEYQQCSLTPASAVGELFDTQTAAECEAACQDKAGEGCTAWTWLGPSASFPDNPGKCRLVATIFKEDESTRSFCGKL